MKELNVLRIIKLRSTFSFLQLFLPCYKQCFVFNYPVKLPLSLMKRWLTFILLLVILAGTAFPCCLIDECNDEELAAAQQENKKQTEGNCSPFFACASCQGFAEMSKPVQIIHPVIENKVHHETFIIFNLTTYASSFWQPPRFI